MTAFMSANSVEKTTGIPFRMPRAWSRLRTARANVQLIDFEMSAMRTCAGSVFAPAPMEETIGIWWV